VKSESHSTVAEAEAVVPQAGFRKERSTVAEAIIKGNVLQLQSS
jgi:hypothetical protein